LTAIYVSAMSSSELHYRIVVMGIGKSLGAFGTVFLGNEQELQPPVDARTNSAGMQ